MWPTLTPPTNGVGGALLDGHSLTPDGVLALVGGLSPSIDQVRVVGCEPASVQDGIGLTPAVDASVGPAIELVRELIAEVVPRGSFHVGAPAEAEGEETPEGHVLRFEPGTQRIIGLTVMNARWLLDRDGRLIVTIPETVEASADELAPALTAA